LDKDLADGFKAKKVVTICGLSGMGKSSFAISCLKNLANIKQPSAMFAMEMTNEDVITKVLSAHSGVLSVGCQSIIKNLMILKNKYSVMKWQGLNVTTIFT
jgi:replicative DNA helicase